MRFELALMRRGAGVLAAVLMAAWALVIFLASTAKLAAGLDWSHSLAPTTLAATAVAVLPEVLAVSLPVALAHTFLDLEEAGELTVLRGAGVAPWRIGVALLAPLAPFVVLSLPLVHETRPCAMQRLLTALAGSDASFERGLAQAGVGMSRVDGGARVLTALGEETLALTASRLERQGPKVRLADGTVCVAESPARRAGFAEVVLQWPPFEPGLADLTERELSTPFLRSGAMAWRRSRPSWDHRRSGELIDAELRRRDVRVPCLGLALLFVTVTLLGLRRLRLVIVHGLVTPVGVAAAALLPRLLA